MFYIHFDSGYPHCTFRHSLLAAVWRTSSKTEPPRQPSTNHLRPQVGGQLRIRQSRKAKLVWERIHKTSCFTYWAGIGLVFFLRCAKQMSMVLICWRLSNSKNLSQAKLSFPCQTLKQCECLWYDHAPSFSHALSVFQVSSRSTTCSERAASVSWWWIFYLQWLRLYCLLDGKGLCRTLPTNNKMMA